MKTVRVVCLDDDPDFIRDLKITIEALEPEFFKELNPEIKSIEIVGATDPEEAFRLINDHKQKIELLILDIELKYEKLGHEEYDRLFYEGKPIPAIVVSAFAITPDRQNEIRSKGISVIIDKLATDDLEEEIARSICSVLQSGAERILKLRQAVERLKIPGRGVTVRNETKTIKEWFQIIVAGTLDPDHEEELKREIADECWRGFRMEQDHNRGFKRHD